tara:strand:+ start:25 stop:1314 length:1290 start_codon:yes stop_codon:yes gene_type:complete
MPSHVGFILKITEDFSVNLLAGFNIDICIKPIKLILGNDPFGLVPGMYTKGFDINAQFWHTTTDNKRTAIATFAKSFGIDFAINKFGSTDKRKKYKAQKKKDTKDTIINLDALELWFYFRIDFDAINFLNMFKNMLITTLDALIKTLDVFLSNAIHDSLSLFTFDGTNMSEVLKNPSESNIQSLPMSIDYFGIVVSLGPNDPEDDWITAIKTLPLQFKVISSFRWMNNASVKVNFEFKHETNGEIILASSLFKETFVQEFFANVFGIDITGRRSFVCRDVPSNIGIEALPNDQDQTNHCDLFKAYCKADGTCVKLGKEHDICDAAMHDQCGDKDQNNNIIGKMKCLAAHGVEGNIGAQGRCTRSSNIWSNAAGTEWRKPTKSISYKCGTVSGHSDSDCPSGAKPWQAACGDNEQCDTKICADFSCRNIH